MRKQDKNADSHRDFDWVGHRRMSDKAYEKAHIMGDLSLIKSHDILQDGEQEIAFAMDIARIYLGTTPRGRALDVACGCGYMTKCLKKAGFSSAGFDISQKGVALARENYPDISFFCGDGTNPEEFFAEPQFDLIHIREFHPFTRVDDFDFQLQIINKYLDILNSNGVLFINHSRRRDCGNLNMEKVKRHFLNTGIRTAGPLYFFPHKHLKIPPGSKFINTTLSFLTKIYAIT